MTVQKDVTKNIYVGNGSTRTFPFTFECPAEHPEYIKVYLMQDDGTALATSDYQLDMDAKQITYPSSGTALPEGKKLVIMRELPLQQMMNLVNNGPYFAEDIETAFDECVMAMQQIAEKLNRSIIMSVDIDGDVFVNEVPFEAGKSFRIADDGKSIVLTEDPGKVIDEAKGLAEETATNAQEAKQAAAEIKTIYNSGGLTPITDLAGSIGTAIKRWGYIFANKVFAMNLPIVYKSVAEMKADSLLFAGMTACTLGYYAINDGGGGTYIIRAKQESDVDDGGSVHELASGLVAELVVENGTVCPEQFGAKGDGVTDDTEVFRKATATGYRVKGSTTKTYYITGQVRTDNNIYIQDCNLKILSQPDALRIFLAQTIMLDRVFVYSDRNQTGSKPKGHNEDFISSNVILAQTLNVKTTNTKGKLVIKNCVVLNLLGLCDAIDCYAQLENNILENCDYQIYSERARIDINNVRYNFDYTSYNSGYHFAYLQEASSCKISNCYVKHNGNTNLLQCYGLTEASSIVVSNSNFDGAMPLYVLGKHNEKETGNSIFCFDCFFTNAKIGLVGGEGKAVLNNVNIENCNTIAINANEKISLKNCDIETFVCCSSGGYMEFKNCNITLGKFNILNFSAVFINCFIILKDVVRYAYDVVFKNCTIERDGVLLMFGSNEQAKIKIEDCDLKFTEIALPSFSETPLEGKIELIRNNIECQRIRVNKQTIFYIVQCYIVFSATYENLVGYPYPLYNCVTTGMIRFDNINDLNSSVIVSDV